MAGGWCANGCGNDDWWICIFAVFIFAEWLMRPKMKTILISFVVSSPHLCIMLNGNYLFRTNVYINIWNYYFCFVRQFVLCCLMPAKPYSNQCLYMYIMGKAARAKQICKKLFRRTTLCVCLLCHEIRSIHPPVPCHQTHIVIRGSSELHVEVIRGTRNHRDFLHPLMCDGWPQMSERNEIENLF